MDMKQCNIYVPNIEFSFLWSIFNLCESQHETRKAEICNCICCIFKVIETSASELFHF